MPAIDLMDDVYSLHTEKDIEHRTQLQHKQREIDNLNKEKYDLVLQNKQLQHNMALLLVSKSLYFVIRLSKRAQPLEL